MDKLREGIAKLPLIPKVLAFIAAFAVIAALFTLFLWLDAFLAR